MRYLFEDFVENSSLQAVCATRTIARVIFTGYICSKEGYWSATSPWCWLRVPGFSRGPRAKTSLKRLDFTFNYISTGDRAPIVCDPRVPRNTALLGRQRPPWAYTKSSARARRCLRTPPTKINTLTRLRCEHWRQQLGFRSTAGSHKETRVQN